MVEILILISLSGKIGKIVSAKGYSKGKYQAMLWGMWFGGEVLGAIVGQLFANLEYGICLIYLLALSGAAAGGWLAFRIAGNLPPADEVAEAEYPERPAAAPGAAPAVRSRPKQPQKPRWLAFIGVFILANWLALLFNGFAALLLMNLADSDTVVVLGGAVDVLLLGLFAGFLVGGVAAGWRRAWAWAGITALVCLLYLPVLWGMRQVTQNVTPGVSLAGILRMMFLFLTHGLLIAVGFVVALARDARFHVDELLPRLLTAGVAAFLITGFANQLILEIFLFPYMLEQANAGAVQTSGAISFLLAIVWGLIQGAFFAAAFEWPRLINARPAGAYGEALSR